MRLVLILPKKTKRFEEGESEGDMAAPKQPAIREATKSVYEVKVYTEPLIRANTTSLIEYRRMRQTLIQKELEEAETEEKTSVVGGGGQV